MRRDLELFRSILLRLRDQPGEQLTEMPRVDAPTFYEHARELIEVDCANGRTLGGAAQFPGGAVLLRLTSRGREFADLAARDTLWSLAQARLQHPDANADLSAVLDVLRKLAANPA
jgi:hypothetical protein